MKNIIQSQFPSIRMRRSRRTPWIRSLLSETMISPSDLILPIFIQEGRESKTAIKSMPGVYRLSIDLAIKTANEAANLGIPAIALFPVVNSKLKSKNAEEAYNEDNLICQAIKAIKGKNKKIGVICDVALDPYTTDGHDGVVISGEVVNDDTVKILCQQAITLAKAGCDIVAPSDMMDGRVGAIRQALDNEYMQHVSILSYAAKYASCFYGPFREAVGSKANLGKANKKTYQMDIANSDEALREVAIDIAEGSDMIMVKPGLPYLDIIRRIKDNFSIPVFAYQVSGEYAMIKFASENNALDENAAFLESIIAFKRAGARGVFTYAAIEIAKLINKSNLV